MKVVMPDTIKEDLCNHSATGQSLFDTFVKDRILTGEINIWSTLKRRKLLTWKSNAKKVKVSTKERIIELREDRSLFARMMMVCRSRPEIDFKQTIGLYEFTLVPRSLFAPDGAMLRCSNNSTLMAILERMPSTSSESSSDTTTSTLSTRPSLVVNIIDGMAELQSVDKPGWVHNCAQLADHFIATLDLKYGTTGEVRLVFDRYDIATSLKEATRERRQAGQDPIYYRITESTLIRKVPMKRLLSHPKTKMELTIYFAGKILEHA